MVTLEAHRPRNPSARTPLREIPVSHKSQLSAYYVFSLPRRCSVGALPVHLLNACVKALGS